MSPTDVVFTSSHFSGPDTAQRRNGHAVVVTFVDAAVVVDADVIDTVDRSLAHGDTVRQRMRVHSSAYTLPSRPCDDDQRRGWGAVVYSEAGRWQLLKFHFWMLDSCIELFKKELSNSNMCLPLFT